VHHDLVREIDEPSLGEAGENAALDDADEGSLVTEIGRDGDDPARARILSRAQRSVYGTAASRSGSMSSPQTAQVA